MKTTIILLMLGAAAVSAQETVAGALRQGIVAEESKSDLNGAVEQYKTALARFDEVRQAAGTALFRLAECYRKLGKEPQAIAAYRRVVRDFEDQKKLADESKAVLAGTYHTQTGMSPEQTAMRSQIGDAMKRYRVAIEEEIHVVDQRIAKARHKVDVGMSDGSDVDDLKREKLHLERELASFDMGRMPEPTPSPARK